jgi:cytochrome bd ubiquinol oxidase subunit II
MNLNALWFILITILFTGFFVLEGFDYGAGILLPFISKKDEDRRMVLNAIGPFWDGNEVWLITAGGAMFAAFPNWYATMFSGFYVALVLMLLALIVRGVGFEFRGKVAGPIWRSTWDWLLFAGSIIPALLWGVALSNIIRGVPIDAHMNYVGGFWNLLNPYALLGGMVAVIGFALHGAIFLALKTTGAVLERAHRAANRLWPPMIVLLFLYIVAGYFSTDMFARLGVNPGVAPVAAGAAMLSIGWLIRQGRHGWAFIMSTLGIVLSTATVFLGLYPRVLVSSLNPDWSLTIYSASSSAYTLTVMTIIALIFVPIVLLYQGWTYWIFRERISRTAAH